MFHWASHYGKRSDRAGLSGAGRVWNWPGLGMVAWIALGMALAPGAACAETAPAPLLLTSGGKHVSLDSHVLFARDTTGALDIEERASLHWFAPEAKRDRGVGFGYTADAIWARMDVENGSDRDFDAQLTLSIARLGRVTWWVLDGERLVDTVEDGLDAAVEAGRYPALVFRLPAREVGTVFLRVESDTAIWISLSLVAGGAPAGEPSFRDSAEFSFVGAAAAVLLMSFLLGVAQRSRLYVWLSVIVGAFLGYYLVFNGYYTWLGGPWQRWANRNLVLALSALAHWALLEFTIAYLRLSAGPRRHMVWLRWISIGVGAGVLALCVLPFRTGLVVLMAMLVTCFASGIPASLLLALRSHAWPNRLLVVAWLLLAVILATTYAELYAWLPAWVGPVHPQRAFMLTFYLMVFIIVAAQRHMEGRERERALLAEQSATVAQLQALRYQLNPHFLYNTLTSIDALSRASPQRIPELVRKLATYLRLRLHPSADGMTTVESELNSVRAYLGIEQVRFEESLRVRYEIGPGVEACRAPEMIFQPLVENAIKHGMPPEGTLEISIRVARAGGCLDIRVENNGHLGAGGAVRGRGVGLHNVTERLACVYGDAARFDLREEEGRVVAEIRLPVEEAVS